MQIEVKQDLEVRLSILYECKTWIMNRKEENKLTIWQSKILQRIFRGVKTTFCTDNQV